LHFRIQFDFYFEDCRKLRFAFLIFKYFPYGGVQRDMLRIAEDCAKAGHKVTIYTGEWRGDLPANPNLQVTLSKSAGWSNHQRHQSLINAMQASIKLAPVDLVVGFNRMTGLDVYYAADPCFMARAYEEKNWLYRLTGRFRFFRDCEKAVFDQHSSCKILLLTERDKTVFQHWYHTQDSRFFVLPPNIPADKFSGKNKAASRTYVREQFGLPSESNVMLTIGSAYLRKGVDRAMIALANLPEAIKQNTWLIAVGEHESASTFMQDAKKLGVAERCILAGGRADVADLMFGADVLAHPARSELAGIVLMEAMTAGLPIIVTDVCGYAEHVKKAGAGVVLQSPFEQAMLNAALLSMLSARQAHWSQAGIDYTQVILKESSPSVEADLIVQFAQNKMKKA
jgi:UDP-glucose:(heptosyl)LPS alpha-1,3-glucosyltransferase